MFACVLSVAAGELIPDGAQWRYFKGTTEASSPTFNWRGVAFNDSAWLPGPTPIFYGELLTGTELLDMDGGYTSVFMRKTFNVTNPNHEGNLELVTRGDDGFIAWINGVEVLRYNVPNGELAAGATSLPALTEPIQPLTTSLPNGGSQYLIPGQNVLAIHAFNSSLADSSDFLMEARLTSSGDPFPPTFASAIPAPNSLVRELMSIEIAFNEPVTNVQASDLLIDNRAATGMQQLSPSQFLFVFQQPATGIVQVAWAANHGITDLAPIPNAFVANSWTYNFDPNAPEPQIMISEFMADNNNTLNDENGDNSDWIEIFNPTANVVDLTGWHLSNTTNNLGLWKFPAVSLPANSYLVVFASSKNRTNPAAKLHTSFNIRKEGGYLALSNPQTNVVSEFVAYPAQREDVSYGRERTNPTLLGFFPRPTPGAANTPGGPGFGPDVIFSMPSRTFVDQFQLTLSSPVPSAVIRYVVGKTNLPDANSPIYTGPITITNSMQVRARAFVDGMFPGDPKSEQYIRLVSQVTTFKSDLPVIILHNLSGGAVPRTGEQFVMMQIFEPRAGVTSLTNAPDLSERARFRLRGSSTEGYPKGSFAVELWNEFGDDKKVSVLGMPEESDWVFYAPNNFEPVLIHNPLMHQLSRDAGRYSSRTRFAEVYLNTGGGPIQQTHYYGIYVIEEKIKRGAARVDVDNLQPQHLAAPEVTGGYLLKIDRPDPAEANFSAGGQGSLAYVDPKYAEIVSTARDPQEQYIKGYINAFGNALNSGNFNPNTGYPAYLDVPAAIDHHILNVFAYNVDALRLSTYLYKPRNGKLTFGPLWDFDRALGSTDNRDDFPATWDYPGGTDFFTYTWWGRLFDDIDFWQKWVDRWEQMRDGGVLSTTNVHRLIDDLVGEVRTAQPREQAKWGNNAPPRGGYQGEVNYLKSYVQARSEFIDSQLVRPPVMNRRGGNVTAGTTVMLSNPAGVGTIYYTTNGTDPRASQGGIAPGALVYSSPIAVNGNMRIVARVRNTAHTLAPPAVTPTPWSGAVAATFIVATPKLAITEIMYNPVKPSNTFTNEDFEFIELHNSGTSTINLAGFAFTNGIDFTFTGGTIASGGYVILVKNRTVFESRYGTGLPIAGQYTGSLDNNGERVTLVGPMLEPVADITYSETWYPLTDEVGFSLVPRGNIVDSTAATWRSSTRFNGSPGTADQTPSTPGAVIISEALAHTDPPQSDFVELHNSGTTTVDITGWYLSDDLQQPKKFRIPATQLAPGAYRTFTEAELNAGANGFALSSTGDDVYLFSANATGELTGYIHGFEFGATANGVSLGRERTSDGAEFFVARTTVTSNAPNSSIKLGPLVVTEFMFQPSPVATFDNTRDEFIEIRNNSAQSVPLFDPAHATNTWRIRGGVDFDFPQNISLAPGALLLVVNFNPLLEPWAETQFRSRFNVPASVPFFGPLSGKLSNTGEQISLQRPDNPQINEPDTVPYIVVDEFTYRPESQPFASGAGTGQSIHRQPNSFAQDPLSWIAADPNAGAYAAGSNDADNDGLPAEWENSYGLRDDSSIGNDGPNGDPDGDGLTNLEEYRVGTSPIDAASALRFTAIDTDATLTLNAADGKTYSVLVTTDLANFPWQKLTDIPAGSARSVNVTDVAPPQGSRFYRIVSPALP
ncbi:MAG TPA: lamin tail domain-containing protein [Verrucomicrobiae bacterium]